MELRQEFRLETKKIEFEIENKQNFTTQQTKCEQFSEKDEYFFRSNEIFFSHTQFITIQNNCYFLIQ